MPRELTLPLDVHPRHLPALNRLHDAIVDGRRAEALGLLDIEGLAPVVVLGTPVGLQTPLTQAAQHGHVDLLDDLAHRMQDVGLNPDDEVHLIRFDRLHTGGDLRPSLDTVVPRALENALRQGHAPVVQRLLELGANPNAPLGVGDAQTSPLMLALLAPNVALAALLLEFHADPNAGNALQQHPLSTTVLAGRADQVELLLLNGADASLRHPVRGTTALHTLVTHWRSAFPGHLESLGLLMQHGANPWVQDANGHSVWDVAPDVVLPHLIRTWAEQEQRTLRETFEQAPAPTTTPTAGSRSRL